MPLPGTEIFHRTSATGAGGRSGIERLGIRRVLRTVSRAQDLGTCEHEQGAHWVVSGCASRSIDVSHREGIAGAGRGTGN